MGNKKHDGHADEGPDVSFINNPDVRHEESDVRIKPIIWFGVWLAVAAVIIHIMLWVLFGYFDRREAKAETPPPALADERQPLPPEPRLQLAPSEVGQTQPDLREHPLAELKTLKEEEERLLTTYGVDERTGAIRIPIQRAKELVLERNLLKSAAGAPQPGAGNRPSRQSSGTATERSEQ
jgi:hypothetical protein